jgi:hypothetical protein
MTGPAAEKVLRVVAQENVDVEATALIAEILPGGVEAIAAALGLGLFVPAAAAGATRVLAFMHRSRAVPLKVRRRAVAAACRNTRGAAVKLLVRQMGGWDFVRPASVIVAAYESGSVDFGSRVWRKMQKLLGPQLTLSGANLELRAIGALSAGHFELGGRLWPADRLLFLRAFARACSKGRLEVARDLAGRFGVTPGEFVSSSVGGHDVVPSGGAATFAPALVKAAKHGHAAIVRWLAARFGDPIVADAADSASNPRGDFCAALLPPLARIKFLPSSGDDLSRLHLGAFRACEEAAASAARGEDPPRKLEVIRWLAWRFSAHREPRLLAGVMRRFCYENRLAAAQWLYRNTSEDEPYDLSACYSDACSGYFWSVQDELFKGGRAAEPVVARWLLSLEGAAQVLDAGKLEDLVRLRSKWPITTQQVTRLRSNLAEIKRGVGQWWKSLSQAPRPRSTPPRPRSTPPRPRSTPPRPGAALCDLRLLLVCSAALVALAVWSLA